MSRATTCFVIGLALALAAADARAEDQVSPQARSHFEAGVALLQDPDGARYEEAYREFRAAYALSKNPRALGNIGFCAMKLERDLEAIEAYSTYLQEVADIDLVEREQIRRDISTLKSGLVRVTITVKPQNAVVVDSRQPVRGEPVSNVYVAEGGRITVGLRPGRHVLRARVDGRDSPPWEVEAAPGATLEHTLEVPPPAPPARPAAVTVSPNRAGPILTMAVGGAALAAGGVTGYLALRRTDDIAKACPDDRCPAAYDLDSAQRKTRTLTTMTDVLLVSGGVLVVGGVTWFLLQGSGSRERRASAKNDAGAVCTGAGCFATWEGRF
jgi:hypothetical protein